MAKSVSDELQLQIEAMRREAFAAGYAAAMVAIHEFANRPASGTLISRAPRRKAPSVAEARQSKPASRPRQRAAATTTRKTDRKPLRLQRGTNAKLVEEILLANAPRALRAAEIRTALQHDKGAAISFAAVGNALRQLQVRNSVEQNGRSWRSVAKEAAE